MNARRRCHALIDDEKELLRECGAPATLCVKVRCLVPGENFRKLIDKYYCCPDCAPRQEAMEGITVESIEEASK